MATLWVAVISALVALGVWQVQRLSWKLDLIARVDARLKAAPVPAPTTAKQDDAYRRVFVTGTYLKDSDSFVQASTVRGPGWWVMTPLQSNDGRTMIINRGYVAHRQSAPVGQAPVTLTGLLRLTELGGGFLRHNDPAADRWYSRDVAAIAARRGIRNAAPYFIDADAINVAGQPVGGLTVISFSNNHLVYAITWFILAVMASAGFVYWIILSRRRVIRETGQVPA